MNLSNIFSNAVKLAKANSPEILTGMAIGGVATTAYLSAKGGYESARALSEESPYDSLATKAKKVWPLYIPAAVAGVGTATCVFFASKASAKRTAAAISAYSLVETAFGEYREKVIEQIGKNKEEKLRDEIAQDKITKTYGGSREVIVVPAGNVLCCELRTMRYFRSDMEILRRAQNDINQKIISHLYVNLDEFYDLIGLYHTTDSNWHGWDSDKLMELEFSSGLTPSGEPCLAFDYNYVKPLS